MSDQARVIANLKDDLIEVGFENARLREALTNVNVVAHTYMVTPANPMQFMSRIIRHVEAALKGDEG